MTAACRRTTGLIFSSASLSLLISAVTFAGAPQAAQAPAAPSATPVRPTGPPPGSPPPGSRCSGCGTAPDPVDAVDRTGWTQIFDGKTLANWDGNPEVWKVEDGAIVAESWPERRVGGTFIIWRGGEPSDFELKLDVKADYDIHSGIFYRGTVGPAPPRAGGAGGARGGGGAAAGAAGGAPAAGGAAAPAGAGGGRAASRGGEAPAGAAPGAAAGRAAQAPPAVPSDPKWNVRGYSMDWDYDPGNNGNVQDPGAGRTDTQIVWRGFIVRTESGKRPRAIGSLGERNDLMQFIKVGDWNQVHIVARGNQITHIVNGHVMAVLIDDDPNAFKAKGVIALQIEQFGQGKINFRNIWLRQ